MPGDFPEFLTNAYDVANGGIAPVCGETVKGIDRDYEVLDLKVDIALSDGERGMAGDALEKWTGDAFLDEPAYAGVAKSVKVNAPRKASAADKRDVNLRPVTERKNPHKGGFFCFLRGRRDSNSRPPA